MNTFETINMRLHRHAEYSEPIMRLFGIVSLINYPIFYLYWKFFAYTGYDDLWIRVGAMVLCSPLALKNHWPSFLKKYIPIYWYLTIIYCFPFFGTYIFLKSHGSTNWAFNLMLGLFWLITLIDWVSFSIVLPLGMCIGCLVYKIQGEIIYGFESSVLGVVVNISFVVIISLLFLRKKDLHHKEKLSAMKMLAGSIAHELRTPLSAIMMNADALCRYLPFYKEAYLKAEDANLLTKKLQPQEHANLNKIPLSLQKLSGNAQTMINMLLTNLSEGNNNNKEELCSMNQCIKEALTEYPFAAHQKTMVHWDNKNDFLFLGQKQMMKHVIFNLLKNALYAIAAVGKGEISIHLESSDANGTNNRLVFKDTGSGIDAGSLPHIFDRFYTKTRHGTGIGLAFCQSSIRGFGGEITCSSQHGEHTIFTITLPILKDVKLREVVA